MVASPVLQLPERARLDLLGPVSYHAAGRTWPFSAERSLQLLVFLGVRASWVARDEIAALFWPDKRNEDARRNLRRVLHSARHLEFDVHVEQRADLLRWVIDTDVAQFMAQLKEGLPRPALGLVRGPFGVGMESAACPGFNDWLLYERGRVMEQWRSAVLAQLPHLPPATALDYVERLLAADEFDDEALRAKLQALCLGGRTHEVHATFLRYAERLAEELGVEPSASTRTLAAELSSTSAQQVGPLRAAAASANTGDRQLVGRQADLEQICDALSHLDRPLVTLTGPGGVGKTRLARAVRDIVQTGDAAQRCIAPDGVLWIDLTNVSAAVEIAPRVAGALALNLKPGPAALEQVMAGMRGARRLIVFDNCEHLIQPGAKGIGPVIVALLAGCPGVRLLATSRRRLDVPRERAIALGGLGCEPADGAPEVVLSSDAARLFLLRASSQDSAFDPNANANGIGRIAVLTEGLPLALELAAAWVRLLPCSEIALELEASLDVLEPRSGNRGMRAVIERSWQLAGPHERGVLAQLAVFVGSFARDAARSVAGASLPSLASLADAALLQVDQSSGASRFSLHPLVREFAREKLAADRVQLDAAQARHMDYFARFLQQFAEFKRIDQKAALNAIGQELENCIAAWNRAVEARNPSLIAVAAAPLEHYFNSRGRFADGIALLDRAAGVLDEANPAHLAALTCSEASLAILQFRAGAIDAAERSLRRALSRACVGGLNRVRKSCLNTLALVLWHRARWSEAKRYFAEALKLARAERDTEGEVAFLGGIAMVEKAQGRLEIAGRLYSKVVGMNRQSSNFIGLTSNLNNLGNLRRVQGRLEEARAAYSEGLAICETRNLRQHQAFLLVNLGLTAFASADFGTARDFAERSLEAARANGSAQIEANAKGLLARLAVRRSDLAAARTLLADGLGIALSTGIAPLESVLLTWYGEVLSAQGETERAASVWNYVAVDPRTETETRIVARSLLDSVDLSQRERGIELSAALHREELLAEVMQAHEPDRAPTARPPHG